VPPPPASAPDSRAPRPAELVRTVSLHGSVAARAIIGSELVAHAMSLRQMAPTAANALGRTLMGAVLVAVGAGKTDSLHAGETVQVQLRGDGPLGTVLAISDAAGRVRGTVARPGVDLRLDDESPDVGRAIGLGTLTLVRHRPGWREPYSGTVPLVSGEVAKDLALYLTESEQSPSAIGLGVAMTDDESAVAAGGFLVQVLPDARDDEVARVEANVRALPRLSDLVLTGVGADEILDQLLDGVGSRARHRSQPVFHCPCTRERALRTLQLLGRSDLLEMIESGGTQEVRCHFCGRGYDFGPDEMRLVAPPA
jgi:molecular chaperone Hsp33